MPKEKTALWLLKRVRRVLGQEKYFAQCGSYAVDADGVYCAIHSPKAQRWCLVGGILRADSAGPRDIFEYLTEAQHAALDALYKELPKRWRAIYYQGLASVSQYSEKKGHTAVVKLLDRAIERLSP